MRELSLLIHFGGLFVPMLCSPRCAIKNHMLLLTHTFTSRTHWFKKKSSSFKMLQARGLVALMLNKPSLSSQRERAYTLVPSLKMVQLMWCWFQIHIHRWADDSRRDHETSLWGLDTRWRLTLHMILRNHIRWPNWYRGRLIRQVLHSSSNVGNHCPG